MFRGHVEVARLGRVVGGLFGDVVCSSLVVEVPVAGEYLAEDRVERLLYTTANWLAGPILSTGARMSIGCREPTEGECASH